jgi:DNA transformation protein
MKNNELSSLPNIGKVLSERLREVGIETEADLKTAGSENAFIRLKTVDEGACINELCALEGAIQGIRWHGLEQVRKDELKAFYEMTQKTHKT